MTATPTGAHRADRGAHRGPGGRRTRTRRARRGVRALAVLAVAALATGFGLEHPGLLDRSPDTVGREAPVTSPPTDTRPGADAPSPSSTPADDADDAPERAPEPQRRPVPDVGSGTFRVAGPAGTRGTTGTADLTYTVEVEGRVPFGPAATAARIDRVLADDRGWRTVTGQELGRTTTDPDFRILLASPDTTDRLCAPLQTNGEVSCRNGDLVVLNAVRWATGIPDYAGHLRQYRTYLVNHEVGHRLGYGHVSCTAPGAPAPVMQQQTYGLMGCTRNAWPTT